MKTLKQLWIELWAELLSDTPKEKKLLEQVRDNYKSINTVPHETKETA